MSDVLKVKPWGKGQGDFVEINPGDFDPKFHKLLDEPEKPKRRARKATK